ncbi:MAG: alpha/beta hydrolase, partial [Desulfuromonadaceae bacterium]
MEALQAAVKKHLNQKQKIEAFKGQVLILHSRNDDLVNVSHAERLYVWANEPKQLLIFERGDHNTILAVNEEEYFSAVARFVASCSNKCL